MLDTPPEAQETTTESTFLGGSVVQLVSAADEPELVAVPVVHPVSVTLTDDRVVARSDDDLEWSWVLEDLVGVHHAPDQPWTIFEVPGVTEYGVAVHPHDLHSFRLQLDALRRLAGTDELRTGAPLAAAPTTPGPTYAAASAEELEDATIELDLAGVAEARATQRVQDLGNVAVAPPPRTWRERISAAGLVPGRRTTGLPESPGLAGLEARAISAWFGDHMVLDRVSLDMVAGEVTALIGPSGCGKSTFLRILNRMHELIPSASLAGEVLLEGVDIYAPARRLTDARREIGMVFQKPNPFPAMSIYDNVIASLRLTGTKVDQDTKDDIVESCLSKAGLWNEVKDRLRQPGGGLSGGQQQRLCIARALAIKPRVLLMDEPCSALDPTSTRRIEQTIFELASEVTIVIVTHNMQQALRVSNQCAFFLAEQGTPGVIVEHGPTDAMFNRPQDQRTDDYVNGRFG